MDICPACGEKSLDNSNSFLSHHFFSKAQLSDPVHVMWLNRNISKDRLSEDTLGQYFREFFDLSNGSLATWIRRRFVERFFSEDPNVFVLDMQKPSKYTIMGYVTEHYHFLKQWVRSCAYIIARTDTFEIQKYEVENISEEYFGKDGMIPHAELLLRMGESVGLSRDSVIHSVPLPKTERALRYWDHVCSSEHWLDAMVSMHSLELIADKNVKEYGAKYTYFKPEILEGGISKEASQFLKAGYDADQYHSRDALNLVEKYASEFKMDREVQSYFLRSADYFYSYLEARHERGKMYEEEL